MTASLMLRRGLWRVRTLSELSTECITKGVTCFCSYISFYYHHKAVIRLARSGLTTFQAQQ